MKENSDVYDLIAQVVDLGKDGLSPRKRPSYIACGAANRLGSEEIRVVYGQIRFDGNSSRLTGQFRGGAAPECCADNVDFQHSICWPNTAGASQPDAPERGCGPDRKSVSHRRDLLLQGQWTAPVV